MVRRSRSPLLSMDVTPLRSTVHPCPFCARCLFSQHVLSSPTHGWTKRPSRVHLCSVAVSAIVIRSIRVARFLRLVAGVLRPPTGLTTQFPASSLHEGRVVRERESCDWKPASPFGIRISRITNHSCRAKCITGAKAQRGPNFAELIDFYWDGEPKLHSFGRAARVGSAAFVVRCLFCGTRKLGQERAFWNQEERECCAARLGRAACDSEFANSLLQGGALHSKLRCRPFRAGHNPVALFQGLENLLTFRSLQNVVKCAVCRRL